MPWKFSWQVVGTSLLYSYIFLCLGVASVAKLLAIKKFRDMIYDTGFFPVHSQHTLDLNYLVAYAIITAEILVILGLCTPRYRTLALILCGGLSGLFATYALLRIMEGTGTPCSCFGTFLSLAPILSLLISLGLLIASAVLNRLHGERH